MSNNNVRLYITTKRYNIINHIIWFLIFSCVVPTPCQTLKAVLASHTLSVQTTPSPTCLQINSQAGQLTVIVKLLRFADHCDCKTCYLEIRGKLLVYIGNLIPRMCNLCYNTNSVYFNTFRGSALCKIESVLKSYL